MLEQEKETMDETGRYPSLALHSRMDHTRLESSKRSRFIEDLNQMNPLPSDPSALFCGTNAPPIIQKSGEGTLEQNPHNYGIRPMGSTLLIVTSLLLRSSPLSCRLSNEPFDASSWEYPSPIHQPYGSDSMVSVRDRSDFRELDDADDLVLL